MEYSSQIAKVLHDEHTAVISLMNKLQNFVSGTRPDPMDGSTQALLGNVVTAINGEIRNHFAFEEKGLFSILEDEGEEDMATLLLEEHDIIVPLGREIAECAVAARVSGFDEDSWKKFKRLGLEYSDRLSAHAEKEEMGFVPYLDETIDEDMDRQLVQQYVEQKNSQAD